MIANHTPPPPGAEVLWSKLDRIARRQQGKFLDRQRAAGRLTPELEADLIRLFHFIFGDVATATIVERADTATSAEQWVFSMVVCIASSFQHVWVLSPGL